MLLSLSVQVQPLWVCVVVSWCMVDNLYFQYCVEIVIVFHEGTDDLGEVPDLDANIPQEGAAFPSSHDHDCFRVHFGHIEFHSKP